jgi:hypothetical protein
MEIAIAGGEPNTRRNAGNVANKRAFGTQPVQLVPQHHQSEANPARNL